MNILKLLYQYRDNKSVQKLFCETVGFDFKVVIFSSVFYKVMSKGVVGDMWITNTGSGYLNCYIDLSLITYLGFEKYLSPPSDMNMYPITYQIEHIIMDKYPNLICRLKLLI